MAVTSTLQQGSCFKAILPLSPEAPCRKVQAAQILTADNCQSMSEDEDPDKEISFKVILADDNSMVWMTGPANCCIILDTIYSFFYFPCTWYYIIARLMMIFDLYLINHKLIVPI